MPYSGTVSSVRRFIADALSGLDSPRLEADLILCHVLGVDRGRLHAHPEYILTAEESALLEKCVKRRASREPLQYITGTCSFDGLDIIVTPGCLVPRPETEFLVECASGLFDGRAFLDWGTGTGCIAVAMLSRFKDAFGFLAEKNPDSIACAQKNLEKFNVTERAKIIKTESPSDIEDVKVSLIVSNPPYIPSAVIDSLMPEVSVWEPRIALDGGEDGLAPYVGLFALAERILFPGGELCVEYGGNSQTDALRALAPECFDEIWLLQDLSGCDRIMAWKKR